MPGRARDYMSFVRTEMYPVMKQAPEEKTFAGLSVTTSVQGGEPGSHYVEHALRHVRAARWAAGRENAGLQGTAAFLAKGAGLITQLDQSILRRVPDLSF